MSTPMTANPLEQVKLGDIFRFHYSEEQAAKRHMPYHCFDGQLVAVECERNGIILLDSYWLYQFQPRGDGRRFTVDQAQQEGELTFVCNLNEVEKVDKGTTQYFDDGDVFDLSYQHHCYPYFAIRKGAKRSQEKMRRVVAEKVSEERRKIESAASQIEWLGRQLQKIEDGRLEEAYL